MGTGRYTSAQLLDYSAVDLTSGGVDESMRERDEFQLLGQPAAVPSTDRLRARRAGPPGSRPARAETQHDRSHRAPRSLGHAGWPGGAGKTTTASCLVKLLTAHGHAVCATRQPSGERLGETSRHGGYQGRALACLVAADRYHHLDTESCPALAARKIVVCDRYVASSYVLQRMDGVDIEFIEALNSHAAPPGLAVILTADPATAAARIDTRGTRHRFEAGLATSAQETALYQDTARRLKARGWPVIEIDTSMMRPDDVAEHIANHVNRLLGAPNPGAATQ